MASKTESSTFAQLDKLFEDLMKEAKKTDATVEIKIKIFEEGARYAGLKQRYNTDAPDPDKGRLADIKRKLR